jgi:PEP-CTERM motif-containing protein
MKKVLLTVVASTVALGVFAQGTVIFNNRIASVTSHVWSGGNSQIQGNSSALPDSPQGSSSYAGMTLIGTAGGLTASTTFAQLLAAPGVGAAESSLLPALGVTTFRTGAASGNITQITATANNVPPDAASASFEMVAWDNSSHLYPTWTEASVAWAQGLIAAGRSAEFTVNAIGGVTTPAPSLDNLRSFNIYVQAVPEPASFALAGLGAAALMIFRRRKS